jgi:hypothetical protein
MTLNQQIAKWWLRNAMIRHGHPPESIPVLDVPEPTQPATTSTAGAIAKWAIPALLAATTGAGGVAAYNWWTGAKPAEVKPETPAAEQSGSLYQYLEDNGFHLPE